MKTRILCGLYLLIMLGSIATAQQCPDGVLPTPIVNWAQFQFGPTHAGCNPYEFILNTGNVGNLALKWQTNVSAATNTGGPAVANGMVYMGSNTPNNSVYAFSAATGTMVWRYTTGARIPNATPAVAKGLVYLGGDDGILYALNASTGALVWKYTTGNSIVSSPAVLNGVVYLGSYDKNVYALNASTGALIWSYTIGGIIESSPAVANGRVYIGGGRQQRLRS
jgi:outer membrane protein assembly factor BamB